MRIASSLVAVVLLTSCADRPKAPAEPIASRVVSPASGDTVAAEVLIRLSVTGARVVPANGMRIEGEGHHHLFVDADLTPADSAIPQAVGIHHLGSGADTLRLEGLAPGTHRVITRFAYGNHVPMTTMATDTIWFVVQ
jgi:hypothetical protein